MFFVIQKKHNSETDAWDNGVVNKTTEDEARHQFHAFMSTYAYGYGPNLDYLACSVENEAGDVIVPIEIDDRRPPIEYTPEPTPEPEEAT